MLAKLDSESKAKSRSTCSKLSQRNKGNHSEITSNFRIEKQHSPRKIIAKSSSPHRTHPLLSLTQFKPPTDDNNNNEKESCRTVHEKKSTFSAEKLIQIQILLWGICNQVFYPWGKSWADPLTRLGGTPSSTSQKSLPLSRPVTWC